MRVITRKLLLLIVLIPLLNVLGYYYAVALGPAQMQDRYGFMNTSTQPPFTEGYLEYLRRVAQGSLGVIQGAPLERLLVTPLRNSLILLGIAFGLTVVLGPLLGLVAVSPHTGRIRPGAQGMLTIGASLPGFFLGSLLITLLLYLSRFGLSSARGGTLIPIQGTATDVRLILPVLTLAVRPTMYVAAITASLLEGELQQDYIRVARSKGLRWRGLLLRHVLPNMRATIIATLGQSLRVLVSTLILVEALFDWRGVGRLLMQTVAFQRNGGLSPYFLNPELLALLLMLLGGLILLADLLGSIAAYLADPRLRAASG